MAQLPGSVSVETGGDSGGAEGRDGQSQLTQHRGGLRGGDQGDVAARAEPTQRYRTRAQSDLEQREYVTRRRAAACSDAECSPSPAGGKQALQRLATTASMTTTAAAAATTERPVRSRSPEPTKCPLPSDSDTDSEASDNQVTAFAARGRQRSQRQSQRVTASRHKQHSSELHQVSTRLAQLSHHHNKQEQQTTSSPQPRAQRDHSPFSSPPAMPPVSSVSMPVFSKVRLQHGSHQIQLKLLQDSRLNVSTLNKLYWPSDLSLQAPSNHIIRVSEMRISAISTDPIRIIFEDNQVIVARLYVMPLPVTLPGLLGRDVLSQLRLVVTTDQHSEDHLVD
ncbi:hypothetical protein HGM15179_020616 [Zosterops borbonicus]|uniref:Uncharacterized protein n=1 Tax=Zosterops borbonicus TaxID=364589 RepID=A0A8K1FXI9_9PASS|nr:hypothetical protein HGM15179_020963 [Zosterops borbonicus]TRZ06490.1 hypothetical protein HGM15179_020616 [Zosterops borbonicus]